MRWKSAWLCFFALSVAMVMEVQPRLVRNHVSNICSTWGREHFKTFDGDVFQFPGMCEYNLVSDCHEFYQSFSVHMKRTDVDGNPKVSYVVVTINDLSFHLSRSHVTVNHEGVTLPFHRGGVQVVKNAVYIKLQSKIGVTVMWNDDDAVMVEIDNDYSNRTCGLCGDFNGVPANEFVQNDRKMSPIEFGNKYKAHLPNDDCEDPYEEEEEDEVVEDVNELDSCKEFKTTCEELLKSESWSSCTNLINPELYIQACVQDMCGCNNSTSDFCVCSTLSEFSRQCSHAGGQPPNWRTAQFCAKECPYNMVYEESGTPCIDTCTHQDTSSLCEDHKMDGCFCPPGTVFDDISERGCISKAECQCKHLKIYESGEVSRQGREQCTCFEGRWDCVSLPTPATCAVEEGSHFTTFDGKIYTFHGDCYYTLAKVESKDGVSPKFTILAQLVPCAHQQLDTCLKTLKIVLNNDRNNVLTFTLDGKVKQNTQPITLPYHSGDINIFHASSFHIMLQTSFGLQIQIQHVPIMQVYISLEQSYRAKTRGLCGNFNMVLSDDMKTPQGIVEGTAASFCNSWKANLMCGDGKERLDDPCSLSVENEWYAKHWCALLISPNSTFAQCRSVVDPELYYKRCTYSSCNCEKSEACLCAVFSSYARACAAKGVFLTDWRESVCDKYIKSCPASQTFSYKHQRCQLTCRSLSSEQQSCSSNFLPVDGCSCSEGQYLNEQGICVPMAKCSCYHNGVYVKPGKSINIKDDHCVCNNGLLHCHSWRMRSSACSSPKVFFNCSTAGAGERGLQCAPTCLNLDSDDCDSTECESGCRCPDGLLDDGKGSCVIERMCPCQHDGHLYSPGSNIPNQCNTCTCKSGRWKCTEKKCPGTCVIYGSGHYSTFDQRTYGFHGDCAYVAAKNKCGNKTVEENFGVITENVPCGSTAATCSKNVRIHLGRTEIKLSRGNYEEEDLGEGPLIKYRIRRVGLYIVVESDIGMAVMWDRKTTVRILLEPQHNGQVCGLCGNFDGDGQNDFTIQGQMEVSNVLDFGNSWKVHSSCPDVEEHFDTCEGAPKRLYWAKMMCSIITGETFKECHNKVNPQPYHENCVKDSCACDSGGDCECFCSAVAAYAQACNEAGVCVGWRTPDICPVFCDYYNTPDDCKWHYNPCHTPCYKTCLNPQGICSNPIPNLEGCYPVCPEDKPIFDEKNQTCVDLCPYCIYNGTIYEENEVIYNVTDNMGMCYYAICINSTVINGSEPCPTPTPSTTTKPTTPITTPTTTTPSTTPKTTTPTTTPTTTTPSTTTEATTPTSTPTTTTPSTTPKTTTPTTTPTTTTPSTTTEATTPTSTPTTTTPSTTTKATTPTTTPTTTTPSTTTKATTPSTTPTTTTPSTTPKTTTPTTTPTTTTPSTTTEATTPISTPTTTTPSTTPKTTTPTTTPTTTTPSTTTEATTPTSTPTTTTPSTTTKATTPTTTPTTTTPSTTTKATTPSTTPTTPSTTTKATTPTTTPTTTTPSTTTKPTTPTTTPTTTTPSTTTKATTPSTTPHLSTVTTPCVPKCEWTDWYNVHDPKTDKSDWETYENITNSGLEICANPTEIDCRAADATDKDFDDFLDETGQVVSCDKDYGLICKKEDQPRRPGKCFDYEIRVCCPVIICNTTTSAATTPTTTPTTTTPSTTTKTTTPTTTPTTTTPSTTTKATTPTTTPTTTTPSTTTKPTTPTTTPTTTTPSTTTKPTTPTTTPTTTTPSTTTKATTPTTTPITTTPSTTTKATTPTTTPPTNTPSTTTKPPTPTTTPTTTTPSTTPKTTTPTTTPTTTTPSTTTEATTPTSTPTTTTPSTTTKATTPTTTPTTTTPSTTTKATTPSTTPTTTTPSTTPQTTTPTTTPTTTTPSTTTEATTPTSTPTTTTPSTTTKATTPTTTPTTTTPSTTTKATTPSTTPTTTTPSTTTKATTPTTTPTTNTPSTTTKPTTPTTIPTTTTPSTTTTPTTTPTTTTPSTTTKATTPTTTPTTTTPSTTTKATTPTTTPTTTTPSTTTKATTPTNTPTTTTPSTTTKATTPTTTPTTTTPSTTTKPTTPTTIPTTTTPSTTTKATTPTTTPTTTTPSTTTKATTPTTTPTTTTPSTTTKATAPTTTPTTTTPSTTTKSTTPTTTPTTTTPSTTTKATTPTTTPTTTTPSTTTKSTTPTTTPTTTTPSTTTKPTTPTTTPTTTTPSTTTKATTPSTTPHLSTVTTPCVPKCEWTDWYNVHDPKTDKSDWETYENITNSGLEICANPTEIDCRAADATDKDFDDFLDETGQVVSCDKDYGLICKKEDQPRRPGKCFDYEIRVCCPVIICNTTTSAATTPTTTPTTTTPSTTTKTTTPTTTPTTTTPSTTTKATTPTTTPTTTTPSTTTKPTTPTTTPTTTTPSTTTKPTTPTTTPTTTTPSTTTKATTPTTTPITTTPSTTTKATTPTTTPPTNTPSTTTKPPTPTTTPTTTTPSTTPKTTTPTTTPTTTTPSTTTEATTPTSTPTTTTPSTTTKATTPTTTPTTTTPSTTTKATTPSTTPTTTTPSTTPQTTTTPSTTPKTTTPTTTPTTTTPSTTTEATTPTSTPTTTTPSTTTKATTPTTTPTTTTPSTTTKATTPSTTPTTTTPSTTTKATTPTTTPTTNTPSTTTKPTTPTTIPTTTTPSTTTTPTTTPTTTTPSTTTKATTPTTTPTTTTPSTTTKATTPTTTPTTTTPSTTTKATTPTNTPTTTTPSTTTKATTPTTTPTTTTPSTTTKPTTPTTIPTTTTPSTTTKATTPTTTPTTTTPSTTTKATTPTTTPTTTTPSTTTKATAPTTTPTTTTPSTTTKSTTPTTTPTTTTPSTTTKATTPTTTPTTTTPSTTTKSTTPTTTPTTTTPSTTTKATTPTNTPTTTTPSTTTKATTPTTTPTTTTPSTTTKATTPTTTPTTTTPSTTTKATTPTTTPTTTTPSTTTKATTPTTTPTTTTPSTTTKATTPTTTPTTTTPSTTTKATTPTTTPTTTTPSTTTESTTPTTTPTTTTPSTTTKPTTPTTTPTTTTPSTTTKPTTPTTTPTTTTPSTSTKATTPTTTPTTTTPSTTTKATTPTTTPTTTTPSTTTKATTPTTTPTTTTPSTTTKPTTPTTTPTTNTPSTTTKPTTPTTTPTTTTPSTSTKATTPTTTPTTTTPSTTTRGITPITGTATTTVRPSTLPQVVSTTSETPTTKCFCIFNGTYYRPGQEIFDSHHIGSGICLTMICSDICEIRNNTAPCPTTTTPIPTSTPKPTPECPEWDVVQNETFYLCNCTMARCIENNTIEIIPYECPPLQNITCTNGKKPVLVYDEYYCCQHYACDCVCEGWGDPHYITFDGLYYSYQGNCTYVLMEETTPIYNLKIYTDNVYCDPTEDVSCPRSIIISYGSHVITLVNHELLGAPELEALQNGEKLKLPYSQHGVKVMTTGINLVYEILRLKVVITFGMTGFSVNLPYQYFGRNTQGHCGTCTNNQTDDCMLPGGKLVQSCAAMADFWPANDIYQPNCPIPPVVPTNAPEPPLDPTPCHPDSECDLLKSSVFEACHAVVSPDNFYSGCVFDSCHISNPIVECTSLQTYAAACAQAGVCLHWRNHTKLCASECPSDKVYKPCGPAEQPTCEDNPNDPTLNFTIEGCFCPDGMKLFNKDSGICVKKCGCIDPEGIPREFNERFEYKCQDCICNEDTKTVTCHPKTCPAPPIVDCSEPGFALVNQTDPAEPCCSVFACQCQINTCPVISTNCPIGYKPSIVVPEGKCCPEQKCEPKRVCVHKNAEYQTGSSVPAHDCQDCKCTNEVDPYTGLLKITCEFQQCDENCDMGYEYVETSSDECCGKCVQTSCVVSVNGSTQTLKQGETWSPPDNRCEHYSCIKTSGILITVTSQIVCPPFQESNCHPDTIQTAANGCCRICVEKEKACKLVPMKTRVTQHGCQSEHKVDMPYCEGSCNTFTKYSEVAAAVEHSCSCCKETISSRRTVELLCLNGQKVPYTYTYVEACGCGPTDCNKPGAHQARGKRSLRLP
ncbi:mucin-2-like [Cololabis saira]|uniref:mucin-2-like n=1 Tax=Cololabis saira TaxID=129043 RepID=UPI002AD30D33|nr:mucin-2-like [Cololabis saira]